MALNDWRSSATPVTANIWVNHQPSLSALPSIHQVRRAPTVPAKVLVIPNGAGAPWVYQAGSMVTVPPDTEHFIRNCVHVVGATDPKPLVVLDSTAPAA